MKKIIVTALVAVSVSLTSCDQNDLNPLSSSNGSFDLATGGGGQPGGRENMNGQRPEITPIAIEDLSAEISAYVQANYSGAAIDRAGTDAEGNYLIGISTTDGGHLGLMFDASGNFVEEKQKPRGQQGQMGPRPELSELNVNDLSDDITSYITTNYTGASIEKAGTDAEGNIIIGISTADGGHRGLMFDASGNFVEEKQRPEGQNGQMGPRPELSDLDINDLSDNITSYITANYAEAAIGKAGTDTKGNTIVLIVTGEQKTGLLFNADGSFEKELPPPPRGGQRSGH
jgi:hypothetical protein